MTLDGFRSCGPRKPKSPHSPAHRRLRGLVILAFSAAALWGCEKQVPLPAAIEPARPALLHEVGLANSGVKVRLPGRLRAVKRAELSFNVPGFVAEFAGAEGGRVQVGQVVARLDDVVFKARVRAAQAEFERANTDLERYQRLWETEQAVARAEVDERRTRLEVARTNLSAAQQDLSDTIIRAPFSGVLTRRRLETFANVQAKQAIAELQDLSALEVVIHVPQRQLRNQGERAKALAYFDGYEDQPIPVKLKSYATEADPVTQTYEAVLTLKSHPAGLPLLPGMSVTVQPSAASADAVESSPSIPLGAIATDGTGARFVWVVDAEGQVTRRVVMLGEIRADGVSVASGLAVGERVVAAGVSALRDGMKVRALDAR